MKDERISNYVKLCEEWADKFMKMDLADFNKAGSGIEGRKRVSLRSSISEENMG